MVRLLRTSDQFRVRAQAALSLGSAAGDPGEIAAALATHTACVQKVSDSRHASAQKLLDAGQVPACAAAMAHTEIDVALALGGGITADIYCGQ